MHGFNDWELEKGRSLEQREKRPRIKSKIALVGGDDMEGNKNGIDNEGRSQMDQLSQLSKGDATSGRRLKRSPKTEVTKRSRDIPFSFRRYFRTSYIIRTSLDTPLFFSFLSS